MWQGHVKNITLSTGNIKQVGTEKQVKTKLELKKIVI